MSTAENLLVDLLINEHQNIVLLEFNHTQLSFLSKRERDIGPYIVVGFDCYRWLEGS